MPIGVPGSRLTPEEIETLLRQPQTTTDMLAISKGRMPEDAEVRDRRSALAARLKRRAPETWPPFEVAWDLDPANHHRALDGADPDRFADEHPDLEVRWVEFSKLLPALHPSSRREDRELWAGKFAGKNAGALAHWADGGAMTPPWLTVCQGAVYVGGGNHRLAVARAKGETVLPVLVSAAEMEAMAGLVPLHAARPS